MKRLMHLLTVQSIVNRKVKQIKSTADMYQGIDLLWVSSWPEKIRICNRKYRKKQKLCYDDENIIDFPIFNGLKTHQP